MKPHPFLIALVLLGVGTAHAQEPDLGTEAQRTAGRELYMEKCAQCHGEDGAGQGIAAPFFNPLPRDFTAATYKVRTTASGELPTDEDLRHIIREGMPYTGMPPWPSLSEQQVQNLVYHLKTYSDFFSGPYGVVEPIDLPEAPPFSEASARRGREVFEENQCFDCHGNLGRGDGPSAPTLENDRGEHIRPADMTKRWTFIGGTSREDIYRTFTTGLDGTPMPSYDMPEEDRWALVDYVYSLSRDEPNYATVVRAVGVEEELDLSQGVALFEEAPPAYFPVVGQVIEPGRAFYPGVDGIEVRAVYNQDEVALLLTWHDMVADTDGENGPTLEVPRYDPEAGALAEAAFTATEDPSTPYSDAVAIQLPLTVPEGVDKPYLLFGDDRQAADLWFADLAREEPQRFIGRGSGNIEPAEGDLELYARYEEGAWTAIFKRARLSEDGIPFEEEAFVPILFSVWDGFNEERGNKRGITTWYHLYLEPMETASAALPMAKWALITLLLELGVIFAVRRRHRKAAVTA